MINMVKFQKFEIFSMLRKNDKRHHGKISKILNIFDVKKK